MRALIALLLAASGVAATAPAQHGLKGGTLLGFDPELRAKSLWVHRGLLYVAQNTRDVRGEKDPRIICYDLRGP